MYFIVGVIVTTVFHGVQAGTYPQQAMPKCFSECAVTGLQKLYYVPSNTYTYAYRGRSEVRMEGVLDAIAHLEWETEVDLKWLSPCEVIINLRNPVVMGTKDEIMKELLTKFSLVVTMSEGVVQGLCAHPEEDPISLNFKKGIVSAFQNSLPSLSPIHSGKTYNELDIVGMCPTHYKVKVIDSKYIITKFKNHFECSRRLSKRSETLLNLLFLKSSLPLKSSTSKCVQEIRNGIIDWVACEDVNEIRPTITGSKFIRTEQSSRMDFKEKIISKMSPLNTKDFRRTSLIFEKYPQPQLNEYTPKVYRILEELCLKTEFEVNRVAPRITAHLIRLLEKVPVDDFVKIFQDIQTKKLCPNSVHLGTIFMDIISFVEQDGALKLMIDQIVKGNLTGFRTQLYIGSIFFLKNLTPKSMDFLVPAFESSTSPPTLLLAAGNLIHKYCRYDPNCYSLPSVQRIFKKLSQMVLNSCPNVHLNDEQRNTALTVLKTIGNIGNMSETLEGEVFECVHSENVDPVVRVAGIQSFRLMSCSKMYVNKLLNLVLHSNETTEVRIAAYLEVIRCPSIEDVEKIVNLFKSEENIDVTSFIMSHLRNAVNSQFPSSQKLKNILSRVIVPKDYNATYSQDIDIGYFAQSFGMGIETRTDIIYDKKKNLRKYNFNLLLGFFDKIFGLGEISSRLDNTPFFDPFGSEDAEKIPELFNVDKLKLVAKTLILSLLKTNKDNLGYSSVKKKTLGILNEKSEWDVFLRLFETEFLFFSLATDDSELSELNQKQFGEEIYEALKNSEDDFDFRDNNSTRAFHTGFKIFIPTIQGIPVLVKWETTTLFGANIVINSTRSPEDIQPLDDEVITKPQFSSEVQSFIGYSFGTKVGIRNRNDINLSTDVKTKFTKTGEDKFRLTVGTPKSALETWKIESQVYLLKKLPGKEDTEIVPKSFDDPRIANYSCLPSMFNFPGFKTCWKFNVTNIITSKIFPFGRPSSITFYFEMGKPDTELFLVDSSWRVGKETKCWNLEFGTQGRKTLDKGEIEISFTDSNHYHSVQIFTAGKDESSSNGLRLTMEDKIMKSGSKRIISLYAAKSKEVSSKDTILLMGYREATEKSEQKSTIEFEMKTFNKLSTLLNANIKVLADIHYKTNENGYQQQRKLKKLEENILNQSNNSSFYHFLQIPLRKSLGIPFKESLNHPTTRQALFFLPLNFTIHKLEVELGSGDLQTKSFLRRVSSDKRVSQYRFLTTLDGGRALGGARVTGDIAYRGLLEGSILITSTFIGKFDDATEYRMRTNFNHDDHGTVFDFNVGNISKDSQIALLKYSKSRNSFTSVNLLTEAEFVVFGYTPHYKVEGTIVEQQIGTYQVSYLLTKGRHRLLRVKGSIVVHITSKKTEEEAELEITGFRGGPYHLTVGYTVSKQASRAILDLRKPESQIILIKAYLDKPNNGKSSSKYQMLLPKLMDVQFKIEHNLESLKSTFVLEVFSDSSAGRTLKWQSYIDYKSKKLQAKFLNKVFRTVEDKIIVDADYDISFERRVFLIKGDSKISKDKYWYDLELNLGSVTEKDTFKHLVINITKPTRENFFFEALYHDRVFSTNAGDVTTRFEVSTFNGKVVEMESNFCYIFEPTSNGVHIAGHINVTAPGTETIVIKVETVTKLASRYKQRFSEIIVADLPAEEREAASRNFFPQLTSKIDKRTIYPERDLTLRIEIIFPSEILHNITVQFEKNSSESKIDFQSFKNSEQVLRIRFGSSNQTQMFVQLFTPSTNMEIASKVFSKDSSLTLYPNKEWSTSGHVVGGRYIKGSKYIYEDRATQSLFSSKTFLTHIAIPQTSMTGALEMKWANNQSERISFSLESIELTKGSFKTEVIIRSPSFKSNPRILLEFSFTSSVKSLTASFQHEASVPPSASFSGTFLAPTKDQSNFYGFVKTPRNEIEFTSSVNEEKEAPSYNLLGLTFNGTLRSSSYGMYDFSSSYCIPAYVECGANKRGEPFTYVGKIGSQQEFVVVGIDQKDSYSTVQHCSDNLRFQKEVATAAASLYSPTVLHLNSFYNIPKLMDFTKELKEGFKVATSITSDVLDDIWEEIFAKLLNENSTSLTSNLGDTYRDISTELKQIRQHIKNEKMFPDFSNWEEKIKEILNKFLDSYNTLVKRLRDIFTDSFQSIYKFVLEIFHELDAVAKSTLRFLINQLQRVIDFFQSSEDYWDTIEDCMKYIRPSNIWKLFSNFWAFIYDHFNTEILIIKEFFLISKEIVEQEAKYVWNIILSSYPSVKNFIHSIREWIYSDESSVNQLKKIFDMYITASEGSLDLILPLRNPVHSVKSALFRIGLPEHITPDYFQGPFTNSNIWQTLRLKRLSKK